MKDLKEFRPNETDVLLKDNLVRGSILPEKVSELHRNVTCKGNCVIEGPVYANRFEIQDGDLEIQGAVFTQLELYINSEAHGNITFKKAVGSADSVVSRAANCKTIFYADINAKSITLYNAFVAGSIYADTVTLENSVVLGGVFATQEVYLKDSVVGTFNSPQIQVGGIVNLLLPSAFSIEKIITDSTSMLFNLSLADLGSLYRGVSQSPNSGRIEMDFDSDELKTTLTDDIVQKTLRSYTVIGKVLAADLLDIDKFQNHFLLAAASLGSQLLKTYDIGVDSNGEIVPLTVEKIRDFFFDILSGKVEVQTMNGKFDISEITGKL